MRYDHVIPLNDHPEQQRFHLSCGFYDTTSFFFEKANLRVDIHCCGSFTFYSADGAKLETFRLRPMDTGRECYMDVLITAADDAVIFRLPEYRWIDHYPHCDGESDRWSTEIIGIRDELRYAFPE